MPGNASPLFERLKTSEIGDRRWWRAVKSLARKGPCVIPALIGALESENIHLRQGAAKALQLIGSPTVPFWIKALKHPNVNVRRKAAIGIYANAFHAQKAIPALFETLSDSDTEVREMSVVALELLAFLFGPIVSPAIPRLVGLLANDDDYVVRSWAARALGSIGPEAISSLSDLKDAANDVDDEVREAAAEAIQRISQK
ncbi:MAG: hypothetical protein KatS3mg105_2049 [Gemmatales bacterium]|nr:MAG: hypothetical protein KatS3mg105_2049 [Gemmatales bacterium]